MKKLLLAAVLALVCSACTPSITAGAGPATPSSTITAAADTVVISGTKGLILANLLYQSIGTPVAVVMESGVLPAPIKVQVKAVDLVVITALKTGARAQDAATRAREASRALAGLDELSRLTGVPLPKF